MEYFPLPSPFYISTMENILNFLNFHRQTSADHKSYIRELIPRWFLKAGTKYL